MQSLMGLPCACFSLGTLIWFLQKWFGVSKGREFRWLWRVLGIFSIPHLTVTWVMHSFKWWKTWFLGKRGSAWIASSPSDLHTLLMEKWTLKSPGENEGVISSAATPGLVLYNFKRHKTTSNSAAISPVFVCCRSCLWLVMLHPLGFPAIFGLFSPGIM